MDSDAQWKRVTIITEPEHADTGLKTLLVGAAFGAMGVLFYEYLFRFLMWVLHYWAGSAA